MKIALILGLWLIGFGVHAEQKTYLERSDNLQQIGLTALKHNTPVVLFFNAAYCLPCEKLKQRALFTLLRFNQFPEHIQFIEIFIDDTAPLVDFYGEVTDGNELALFYNVHELPTQVFVDGNGREVAYPIVNNGAYDFYGQMVNDRLEDIIKRMQQD